MKSIKVSFSFFFFKIIFVDSDTHCCNETQNSLQAICSQDY